MDEPRKKPLRRIGAPRVGPILSAPPALTFVNHTTDHTCAHCGTVLLRTTDDVAEPWVIRCAACGTYNTTK